METVSSLEQEQSVSHTPAPRLAALTGKQEAGGREAACSRPSAVLVDLLNAAFLTPALLGGAEGLDAPWV